MVQVKHIASKKGGGREAGKPGFVVVVVVVVVVVGVGVRNFVRGIDTAARRLRAVRRAICWRSLFRSVADTVSAAAP